MKSIFILFLTVLFTTSSFAVNVGDSLNWSDFPKEQLGNSKLKLPQNGTDLYIIDFWASWCGPCRSSLPAYTELQKSYPHKNVQFILINEDSDLIDATDYIKEYDVTLPVFRDEKKKFFRKFGFEIIPATVVFDKNLKVLMMEKGFSQKKLAKLKSFIENHVKGQRK